MQLNEILRVHLQCFVQKLGLPVGVFKQFSASLAIIYFYSLRKGSYTFKYLCKFKFKVIKLSMLRVCNLIDVNSTKISVVFKIIYHLSKEVILAVSFLATIKIFEVKKNQLLLDPLWKIAQQICIAQKFFIVNIVVSK